MKAHFDPESARDQVELAKDVGALQSQGGYIVIGCDRVGQATDALTADGAAWLETSSLQALLLGYLSEEPDLEVTGHSVGGKRVVCIRVGKSRELPVFKATGRYPVETKTGGRRNRIAFREGDVFVRRGRSSARATPAEIERLLEERSRGSSRSVGAAGARLRAYVTAAVGLLSFVATVLTLYFFIAPAFRKPPQLTGDLNLAVAKFGTASSKGDGGPSREGDALAESVFEALQRGTGAEVRPAGRRDLVLDIDLASPSQTDSVDGSTPAERAETSAAIASDLQADVVVYGQIRQRGDSTEFSPEFYLSSRKLRHAPELVGRYAFGTPLLVPGVVGESIATRAELRRRVLARTRAMAAFIVGLGYYAAADYRAAERQFLAAKAERGWTKGDGEETLYVFLGNTRGKLRDFVAAGRYYESALRLRPDYGRALFGKAHVEYQMARGGCEAGEVNKNGLEHAIDSYRKALGAPLGGASPAIRTKAHFGLALAYFCLSQSGEADHYADAQREANQVTTAYAAGDRLVREEASEAHALLGLLAIPPREAPNKALSLKTAERRYLRAIELATDADRVAIFYTMLASIRRQLGDAKGARAAEAAAAESKGRR